MADKEKKIDPFDVEALEKSLNDSATRVSTIWVSFLIFSLYLLTAAATVTHRQLFLAEPVKLPVLNIDLPLVGFFFLAPTLLVILHIYVLVQVALLARTAATYNEAVERNVKIAADDERVRQRLANTLFAQIFAGPRLERRGMLGRLLRIMASITLVASPALVLLTFQIQFLPYHHALITWTHRILITLDLALVLALWPGAIDAYQDIAWRYVWRHRITLWMVALVLSAFSWTVLSFPGEPHAAWTRSLADNERSQNSPECRMNSVLARLLPESFDRLSLPNADVVDDEKLSKLESAGRARGKPPWEGERTREFRGRNLRCGDFQYADLRRTDLSGALLDGAYLNGAALESAALQGAGLKGAALDWAQLQGASLYGVHAQGSSFFHAELQGAALGEAHLQATNFYGAKLHGAILDLAELEGASFDYAELQGASLDDAQLQGASFFRSKLQGAFFRSAQLQAAWFNEAQLQGTELDQASLQGATFNEANLMLANLSNAFLWRTKEIPCSKTAIAGPRFDTIVGFSVTRERRQLIWGTRGDIARFIEDSVAGLPEHSKDALRSRMQGQLNSENKADASQHHKVVEACATGALSFDDYHDQLVDLLVELACDDRMTGHVASGIYRRRFESHVPKSPFAQKFARGVLGLDGKPCPGAKDLDDTIRRDLQRRAMAQVLN